MTKKETFKCADYCVIATAILTATGAGICDKAATRRLNRVATHKFWARILGRAKRQSRANTALNKFKDTEFYY